MKKTIIYIIGAGRSGTTLLDIILGNNKDTISLGEINRFFKREGIPPKRESNSNVYKFWDSIKLELEREYKNRLDYKYCNRLTHINEYHTYFLKVLINRVSPEYKTLLSNQYSSILKNVKENTIIESSKYPLRAINLSNNKNDDFDVKFIYLRKDPVKVVNSFNKKGLEQPSKGFLASNFYYLIVNSLCSISIFILKRKNFKVSKIKYEELITKPVYTLKKLEKELECSFELSQNKIENKKPLNTGYLFDGNRIRLKETILLRTEMERNKKNVKNFITRTLNYLIYNQ